MKRIGLDGEVVDVLLADLKDSGVTILEHTVCSSFKNVPAPVLGSYKIEPMLLELSTTLGENTTSTSALEVDIFIAAMGRRPNTQGIGLENISGVIIDEKKKHLVCNDRLDCTATGAGFLGAGDVVRVVARGICLFAASISPHPTRAT